MSPKNPAAAAAGLQDEIADALYVEPDKPSATLERVRRMEAAHRAHAAMTKVAPVLAVKDARIAELEERLPYWVSEFMDAHRIMTRRGELVEDLKARVAELEGQLAAPVTPGARHAAIEAVITLIIAKHQPDLDGHCGTGDGPAIHDDATDYVNAVLEALAGGA